jgi:hypothetical protein
LALVKECGANEKTDEFFVATTLFEKEYHRQVFCSITDMEARLMWLKKWAQKSG